MNRRQYHPFLAGRLFPFGLGAAAFVLSLVCLLAGIARIEAAGEREDQDSLTFIVLGDPQHLEEDVLRPMIRRIKAASPDFVLITGDCVNGPGAASWDRFFDLFAPLYPKPNHLLYAIPGNHDMAGDYNAALEKWLRRWDLPGQEVFYSFNRGPTHVIGLMITREALFRKWNVKGRSITQIQWLKEDLRDIPLAARWRFIFHHEPGSRYCAVTIPRHGGGFPVVSGVVEPLAFEAGVDIIFRGHSHLYERTYPINIESGRRDDARGMVMVTTGGGNRYSMLPIKPYETKGPGGHLLRIEGGNIRPQWFHAALVLGRLHYCKVTIRGSRLTLEAIDLEGQVFDRFEVTKNADGTRSWQGLPRKSVFLSIPERDYQQPD